MAKIRGKNSFFSSGNLRQLKIYCFRTKGMSCHLNLIQAASSTSFVSIYDMYISHLFKVESKSKQTWLSYLPLHQLYNNSVIRTHAHTISSLQLQEQEHRPMATPTTPSLILGESPPPPLTLGESLAPRCNRWTMAVFSEVLCLDFALALAYYAYKSEISLFPFSSNPWLLALLIS